MKTILLIDGENLKGKIRSVLSDAGKGRPIWHEYDFKGLLNKVLNGVQIDRQVFYFARIKEHGESKEKSKQLIEEQRMLKTHLRSYWSSNAGIPGRDPGPQDCERILRSTYIPLVKGFGRGLSEEITGRHSGTCQGTSSIAERLHWYEGISPYH